MTSTRLASSGFSETRVWVECLVSRAHRTWSRSLLFKDIRIFAYSSTREQSNRTSWTRLKTESETGKRIKWDYLFPPPPPLLPPTIKHATGVTDNKKFSSHDNNWLSTPGDTPVYWFIREGSAWKRYLFQASDISKDKDFTNRGIWKGREICHFWM